MKNNSRDFCIFVWGAIVASSWWAMFAFNGLPVGPNNVPVLYILTPIVTLVSFGYFLGTLLIAAFCKDKELP